MNSFCPISTLPLPLTSNISNEAEWKLNCMNSSWSPNPSKALTTGLSVEMKKTGK